MLGVTNGNQGPTLIHFESSKIYQPPIIGLKPEICLKLQIPYYYQLNQWLLGATNGNQGPTLMHFYRSKIYQPPIIIIIIYFSIQYTRISAWLRFLRVFCSFLHFQSKKEIQVISYGWNELRSRPVCNAVFIHINTMKDTIKIQFWHKVHQVNLIIGEV